MSGAVWRHLHQCVNEETKESIVQYLWDDNYLSLKNHAHAAIILGMVSASEIRRYIVTPSLIGCTLDMVNALVCFVIVYFTHVLQGYFTGARLIIWLSDCLGANEVTQRKCGKRITSNRQEMMQYITTIKPKNLDGCNMISLPQNVSDIAFLVPGYRHPG